MIATAVSHAVYETFVLFPVSPVASCDILNANESLYLSSSAGGDSFSQGPPPVKQ